MGIYTNMSTKAGNKKYNQSEKGKKRNSLAQKRYRQTEKGKQANAIRQQRYFESIKGRALQLHTSARQRAQKYKLPFSITREWIEEKLVAGECEVTGTPLRLEFRSDLQTNPFAPSLDQKVARDGYTPENTQVVAYWYNRMKNDLTQTEALQILIESHDGIMRYANSH